MPQEVTYVSTWFDEDPQFLFDVRKPVSPDELEYAAAVYEEMYTLVEWGVPMDDDTELAGYPLAASRVAEWWMINADYTPADA